MPHAQALDGIGGREISTGGAVMDASSGSLFDLATSAEYSNHFGRAAKDRYTSGSLLERVHLGAKWCCAVALGLLVCGCGKSDSPPASSGGSPAASSETPAKSAAGVIAGRVTFPDGKPIDTPGTSPNISIYGVSTAGEKVSYNPAVKADGSYSQKVVPGSYRFGVLCSIDVPMGNDVLKLPLEPVGNAWNKDQDSADGITQNFVWKTTGVTPYGRENGSDPYNHTHWYGLSIGALLEGYRADVRKPVTPPPDGTKFAFTLKPTSKAIDGKELQPIKVERTYDSKAFHNYDINDVPIASYELSGEWIAPGGAAKPMILQGKTDYPNYKPTIAIVPEKDPTSLKAWTPTIKFVAE